MELLTGNFKRVIGIPSPLGQTNKARAKMLQAGYMAANGNRCRKYQYQRVYPAQDGDDFGEAGRGTLGSFFFTSS